MRRLAKTLDVIPGLGYAIYADDITLWATSGSLGQKEEILQEAATVVETFARSSGMSCAPDKSEFIRIRGRGRQTHEPVNLFLGDSQIKEVQKMRVLGLWLQSNKRVDHTIKTLRTTVKQISRMIRRVTYHRKGFKETETIRLVQAFVLSRLTYSLPFQDPTKTELKALDALIRTSYKAALGLPQGTSTERLLALGIHNNYEELRAATLISQRERLSLTSSGRKLLCRVGYPTRPQYAGEELESLPRVLRERIIVAPIPKNMSPKYHRGRRSARARKLMQQFGGNPDTVYTDVARCGAYKYALAVVGAAANQGLVTCATARVASANTAEASAIALAIKTKDALGQSSITLTDSQVACRLFLTGRLPHSTTHLLGSNLTQKHMIIWCPGHAGLEGNERADGAARAFVNRAADHSDENPFYHETSLSTSGASEESTVHHTLTYPGRTLMTGAEYRRTHFQTFI